MRNGITLGQMEKLWADIDKLSTIGEWTATVSLFRDEYGLTDREAIYIANQRLKSEKVDLSS